MTSTYFFILPLELPSLYRHLVELVELLCIELSELGHEDPQILAQGLDLFRIVELAKTLDDAVADLKQTAPDVVVFNLLFVSGRRCRRAVELLEGFLDRAKTLFAITESLMVQLAREFVRA